MQDPSQPENESCISSGSTSSDRNVDSSETSPFTSENIVFTEKKYSSHNSYYLAYDDNHNLNQTPGYITPKHDSEYESVYYTSSRPSASFGDNFTESSVLSEQKPLVASFEYSPSGKCIRSSFPGQSVHTKSFLTPDRRASNEGPVRNGNSSWTTFKGSPKFANTRPYCNVNKNKPQNSIYKSPSSNFACSKCGLGYPCTLFLCKRAKYSSTCDTVKKESQPVDITSPRTKSSNNTDPSVNSRCKNVNFSEFRSSEIGLISPNNNKCHLSSIGKSVENLDINSLKRKNSCSSDVSNKSQLKNVNTIKVDSPPKSSVLQSKKKYSSSSTEKSVKDLISELFPEQILKKPVSNDEELSKKNKVQCKNKSNKSKVTLNTKPMKNTINISPNGTNSKINRVSGLQQNAATKDSNDICLGESEMISTVTNFPLIGSSRQNCSNAQSSKKSLSLSQETRNFLNELDASSASNHFSDKVSDYVLTPTNSLTFDSKITDETVIESNDIDCILPPSNSLSSDPKIDDEIVLKSDDDYILDIPNSLVLDSKAIDGAGIKSFDSDYISKSTNSLNSDSKSADETVTESKDSSYISTSINSPTLDSSTVAETPGEPDQNTDVFTTTDLLTLDSRIADKTIIESINSDYALKPKNSLILDSKTSDKTVTESNDDYILTPTTLESETVEKTVTEFNESDYMLTPINSLTLNSSTNETVIESKNTDCISTSSSSLTLDLKTVDETVIKTDCNYILTPTNSSSIDFKATETFVESKNCDYIVTPTNSLILDSKTADETVVESNDSETNMSVSNEGEGESNIIDVNKDLTNALELIEQSSIYDKDLSSAEICNSLNQIFSESDSANLPVIEDANAANIQIDETPVNMETTSESLGENNESDVFLQTESDVNVVAESENYVNISDFYLGDTPDNVQNILIIQDEDGNVETLYIIQDPENNGESMLVAGNGNGRMILADGSVAENVDNILTDNSVDELQNLLISQGIINNAEDVLITEESALTNESGITGDISFIDGAHDSQSNLDDSQDNSEMKNSSIEIRNMELPVKTHNVEIPVTEEKEENLNPQLSIESTQNSLIEEVTNMTEDSSDKVENILLTLSKNAEISVSVSVDKENKDNAKQDPSNENLSVNDIIKEKLRNDENSNFDIVKENVSNSESSNSMVDNFKKSESMTFGNIHQSRKAKKSSSSIISIVRNAIQESNSDFHKQYNALCEKTGDFGKSRGNTTLNVSNGAKGTPMNGAVFFSEVSTDSNQVGSYTLSNTGENCMSTQFTHFSSQRSKKTFPVSRLLKRSAKKSFPSPVNSSTSCSVPNNSLKDDQSYVAFSSMFLKRGVEDNEIDDCFSHKRAKKSVLNSIDIIKNRTVALKTFKKPFTSAKKSVLDSRDGGAMANFKNTALKTCVSKMRMKTALKSLSRKQHGRRFEVPSSDSNLSSRNIAVRSVNMENSILNSNPDPSFFQPEICEIRILPNEYIKRASSLLIKSKHLESENLDENMSDEEVKLSCCNSPVEELMSLKSKCSCTAKEVPCICNDKNLQWTCEGEDSVDETVVPCSNNVSQQYLLTPSSEIKHRAFCDIHLWRLRRHHCCPKCGIFCSQGEFSLCSSDESEKKENHLFHSGCFLIPAAGLPPSCPHCCKFSSFKAIHLVCKSSADLELKEVPSDSRNITSELKEYGIFMTVNQASKALSVSDSKTFTPINDEMREMITALAKENGQRLRPTGKILYIPVKTGDVQKTMQLIGNGVDPNFKFKQNNTPLHIAAEYGWIGILHILIQAGAMIDALNDDLETPLVVALERNQLPIVRYLVHAGAQIEIKDCNGMTSFHIACKNGYKEIATFLYSTGRIDVDLQDDGGWTALMWSSEHKHLDLVRWLLDIGSDPNLQDKEKNTVLHWAVYSGESEIAQLVLERGCSVTYVNRRGDSALHVASRENNYECVTLLVTYGSPLDQKNKNNQTPLMCCENDTLTYNFLCESVSSGTLKKIQSDKYIVFRDISRGAEAYPIQVINEVDSEEFIMEFRYVVKNCHRTGVDIISTVNNMQFCSCKDNCLTRDCSCTINSKCWYDSKGCLTSEFNVYWPPTIFECNKTCHCPKTCINRVVQRGLRCRLQLFRTWYQGWGVRALQDLPKGSFVCEYVGELITGTEATEREDDTYYFDLESQEADYCLDGHYYGNVARFLNHSCEPNLIAVKAFVDYHDLNFPRIAFFTLRHIKAFEELCFDYGLDFWIVKSQSILCTCNTPSCKYSKDSIDDTLQKFFMDTKNENEAQSVVPTVT